MSTGLEMKYFVLKPRGDTPYAAASRTAMKAYANVIRDENPQLYHDLLNWAIEEHDKVRTAQLNKQFQETQS